MTNHLPQTYQFDNTPVRTVDRENQIWFVAADVCKVLSINNPSDAVARLDDDEKNTLVITEGISGNPNVNIISESGLYNLIFRSRKAQAQRFRKWVTSEVLPAIRQSGTYTVPNQQPQPKIKRPRPSPLSLEIKRDIAAQKLAEQLVPHFVARITDILKDNTARYFKAYYVVIGGSDHNGIPRTVTISRWPDSVPLPEQDD